jgi:hypothetical protein
VAGIPAGIPGGIPVFRYSGTGFRVFRVVYSGDTDHIAFPSK